MAEEALSTKKRRFQKLLDSRFGSPHQHQAPTPPSTTLTTTTTTTTSAGHPPPTPERAAKRIRPSTSSTSLATPSSLLHHQHTRTASNTSLRSTSSVRLLATTQPGAKAPPPPTTTKPKGRPNYMPWSHDAFLKRLQTFAPVTQWHSKPDAVGEVEWAKRGWECVETNTVGCRGGCGERVVVNLEPIVRRKSGRRRKGGEDGKDGKDNKDGKDAAQDGGEETDGDESDDGEEAKALEQALLDKYKALIVEGHGQGCLWRHTSCKDGIYHLPIVKSEVWQPEMRTRFSSLMRMAGSFENVLLKPQDVEPSPEKVLRDFPRTMLVTVSTPETTENGTTEQSEKSTSTQTEAKAFLIAMCGWRGVSESNTDILCCDACFQRIGLWMYQPGYKQKARFADDDDEAEDHSLDLVELHRDHCPWRNPETQAATGDFANLPAWQIMHRILARYASEHRRRSRDRQAASAELASADDAAHPDAEHALEELPVLTREETDQMDKERISKLRRLKSVLGFKKKKPAII